MVVTGAAGGFGSATARAFAAPGAHIVVSDLHGNPGPRSGTGLPSAVAVTTDVTDLVAAAILFLASDQAAFLTGVVPDVDGGRSIQ
ncbi:SDR family NAD(P)-dependent oxidoreductase [Catenuloplanes atrovinosus]|uniref:NAD(P)-dependent dehydrogenase (Short-subunit alcohol dehydrogenase family) n=1 Tax=Catenuloplanes atrovinosus TaxID=137266 RepID=A0AAE3YKS9_9ACTN|nr:SDR family NAD(P)-dependent oxidoreductase [Catenuloplanes atrovinosus]MDR7275648.1 NAD(P)-dependent dehydrogenase (short-subunit alcohol dehydrogenase family) [Catenuloplanes atrovinosus]